MKIIGYKFTPFIINITIHNEYLINLLIVLQIYECLYNISVTVIF